MNQSKYAHQSTLPQRSLAIIQDRVLISPCLPGARSNRGSPASGRRANQNEHRDREREREDRQRYRVSYTYRELAAAYALAGKMEDAKTALAEALRLDPTLTIKSVARTNTGPAVLEGLRKAGMPED